MRIALAANPRSGGGLDPAVLVDAMRNRGAQVTLHGIDADDRAAIERARPDRIAIAGGDGSIAPFAALAERTQIPLAVIPGGTANDFARAHRLPLALVEAARLAADPNAWVEGLELGRLADDMPFVNAASAGLSATAAHIAEPLKPRLGPLAYGAGALRATVRALPMPITVTVDDAVAYDGECWQVILAVSGAFGGGSSIGAADPDDGQIDVVVIPAGSRMGLARRAWGLKRHTLAAQRDVPHLRGHEIRIELPAGTQVNVDGERREGGLGRVRATSNAFPLVLPEDPRAASASEAAGPARLSPRQL